MVLSATPVMVRKKKKNCAERGMKVLVGVMLLEDQPGPDQLLCQPLSVCVSDFLKSGNSSTLL